MKLNIAATPVEQFGAVSDAKEFGFKRTAKAFQVLSSKLYKNKIAAAIRELSANAYDSHVAVWRSDRPFEVHLPTVFEPHFAIRDYGTGLTHTAVETIFTTFFESTKDGSNDFIGALGLGSKSPFALVDSFTVYTYDGTHRVAYLCFKENGMPMVARKARVKSNEETGVEITFPVEIEDVTKFGTEAAAIFQWFNVRPIITGNQIAIPALPALRGSCWSVTPHSFAAVMGQVRYPLDATEAGTTLKNLTVHFDIGEVDIQAGREELSYDKDTVAAIQARLKTVETEIHAIYKKLFRGCKSVFDANWKFSRSTDQQLFQILPPTWKGVEISGSMKKALAGIANIDDFGDKEVMKEAAIDDLTMFVMDVDRTSVKRFNQWHAVNKGKVGYKLTPINGGGGIARLRELFGDLPMVLASSIPLPPKKAKLRTMSRYTTYEIRQKGERTIDLNAGGVYLISKNLNALHPVPAIALGSNPTIGHPTLQSLHQIMIDELYQPERGEKIEGRIDDVVIVPWSRKMELGEGWTNVYDMMAALYAEHSKDKLFVERVIRARHCNMFKTQATDAMVNKIVELIGRNLTEGPVKSFIDDWTKCQEAHRSHDRWRVYENTVLPVTPDASKFSRLHDAWVKLRKDFPLLMDVVRVRNYNERVENIVAADLALYVEAKTQQLAR